MRVGGFVGSITDRIKTSGLSARRALLALAVVLFLACAVAAVWVSALQAQVPRNMPFGVTGPSPVVTAAESQKISGYQISFVNTTYANEARRWTRSTRGRSMAPTSPARAATRCSSSRPRASSRTPRPLPLFKATAKKLGRPLHVSVVKRLPAGKDPVGAVAGTLLTASIVGGMVAAILIFTLSGLAVQRWRGWHLIGITLLAALLTDVIAGPVFGAYGGDQFWSLLPCLWLVTFSTAMVGAALIAVLPTLIAVVVLELLFIVVGMVTAGTAGVALLPTHWQSIGAALPPRYGANLFQNVLYFSSNNITTPIVVLGAYALIAAAVLSYVEWIRPRRQTDPSEKTGKSGTGRTGGPRPVRIVIAVAVVAALYQGAFAAAYTSAGHNPVAHNMPFATTGNSSLTSAVQKNLSLKVTSYSDRSGRTERDRPSQGLGIPDRRYRHQHAAGRPQHQRPRALHPRGRVREGGEKPSPEAHAQGVYADAAGRRRPIRAGARDPAHPAAAVRLPGGNGVEDGDQGHRRPSGRPLVDRILDRRDAADRPHRRPLAGRHPQRKLLDPLADHGAGHERGGAVRRRPATTPRRGRDAPHRGRDHHPRETSPPEARTASPTSPPSGPRSARTCRRETRSS